MTENQRKIVALVKLGIARQSPLEEAGQQVYLEQLASVPSDILERACVELARIPRDDYEPAFPSLGIVIERCRMVRDHDAAMAAPKQLYQSQPKDWTKAEAKAWVERLRRDVQSQRKRKATA